MKLSSFCEAKVAKFSTLDVYIDEIGSTGITGCTSCQATHGEVTVGKKGS